MLTRDGGGHIRPDNSRENLTLPLAAAVILVLVLTLVPRSPTAEEIPVLCLLCGSDGAADFLLNIALFAPVGALVLLRFGRRGRALAVVIALTVLIEALQVLIPGRHPTAGDLAANSLGGLTGLVLTSLATRRHRRPFRSAVAFATSILLAVSFPATLALLEPAIPPAVYHGQWSADLGHLEHYRGTIHDVRLGDRPLPGHRLDPETTRVLRTSGWQADLAVEFTAGPEPTKLAPIFSVFDADQNELLIIGARRDAIVVRLRRRARDFRLRTPEHRFARLHPSEGERITLAVRRRGNTICLRVDASIDCAPLASPARSWGLLAGSVAGRVPGPVADGAWLALLGFLAVWSVHLFRPSAGYRGGLASGVLPVLVYAVLWATVPASGGWSAGFAGLAVGLGAGLVLTRTT